MLELMEKGIKKGKKKKAVSLGEANHSGDAMPARVGDNDKLINNNGKRRNMKYYNISDDIESNHIHNEAVIVKDNVEVDISNIKDIDQKKREDELGQYKKEHKKDRKKDAKLRKDGEPTEIEVDLNEKSRKEFESDFEMESRERKKRKHKDNPVKDVIASHSSSMEIQEDNKLGSDNVLKGQTSFAKEDRVEIKNGEEGVRTKKHKKMKNDKEVSDGKGMGSTSDGENFGEAMEDYDENIVEKINGSKKEKKQKKKKDGELGAGLKEILEDNILGSDNVVRGQTSFAKEDRVETKNGEEGGRAKKHMKRKKDKEASDGKGKGSAPDGEKFGDAVEDYDENTVENINVAKKEKKQKKKKDGELEDGLQEIMAERVGNETCVFKDKLFEEIGGWEYSVRNKIEHGGTEVCQTGVADNKKKRKKTKSVIDGSEEIVHGVEEGEKHRKRKAKSDKDGSIGIVNGTEKSEKGKKKKAKSVIDDLEGTNQEGARMNVDTLDLSENLKSKRSSKKVSFSGHVEVFPSSDGPNIKKKDQGKGLVQGKRFSPEEDEKIRKAVSNYIEERNLGEDGVDKILHCRFHPEVKNCWKEIGRAIPWRPHESVYYRAHVLLERDEKRGWSPEEYEMIRSFHEKHGADWRLLADALGKHRFHVKDTWRRIRLPNVKKGHWSQEEYQTLFDLVNMDLRMKAFQEKKSKHGMLRDNICWEAISDKLGTRINSSCCLKWYDQLTSSLVAEGLWADADDYRLLSALFDLDACCIEDVEWDYLLDHRSGDICRKRWKQMVKHLGEHGTKSFAEQVEVLSQRYCPDLLEAREAYDSKPIVD